MVVSTSLVKLVAQANDWCNYTTYVFERLEAESLMDKYIMCIRYPNWQQPELTIGDIGYVQTAEVFAGIDKWFDGNKMIPYHYTTIQFIKFIEKPEENTKIEYTL